jgi:glycosyltransferase involved in cell wall biosynthesis
MIKTSPYLHVQQPGRTDPQRVLHVIAWMDPKMGGVCQAVRTMILGLSEQQVLNEVVCLDDPKDLTDTRDPFPVHALGPAKSPWVYSEKFLPWMETNLSAFDTVIVHGLWLYHTYAVNKIVRAQQKENISVPRVFVMPHGMLDPYFQKAKGRKLKAIRNWIYWKLIEHKVIAGADALLFTSEEEAALASGTFKPYKPKKQNIVGLGVEDPPIYSTTMKQAFEARVPALKGSPYLLFLSRIHPKKGVDLLIKAYEELIQNPEIANMGHSGVSIPKLLIAGPGLDTEYGQQIEAMIRDSGLLNQNIILSGMLSGNEKWGAFYGSEAFVLPSHQENFGIAVVEAMACEKPVLISDQVNIWREIQGNQAGFAEHDDHEGTLTNLKRWLKLSPQEKSAMSANARNTYLKMFSVQAASQRLKAALSQ